MSLAVAGYIAAVFMGITLGLLGGGGSILTVPILVYLFQLDPIEATTSSLFIVGGTALIASVQFAKRGEIDFKSGIQFAAASFVGIFISRSFILPSLPEHIKADAVLISFACLMVLASLAMLRSSKKEVVTNEPSSVLKTSLYGVAVGAVTGFVGAGGGFLIVPALVNLLGLNMRTAIGTSIAIIAANSLFGFTVSYVADSNVDWSLMLAVLALGVVGSVVGAYFSKSVSEKTLKKVFGIFVLVVGSLIIVERLLLH